MGAATAWFTAIALVLIGIVVLYHMGLNIAPPISSAFHTVEHTLGRPLFG